MDAVKFLEERKRMYESGAITPCIEPEDDYNPVNAVKIVEEWSTAHPRKTRQDVFLEQWPEADEDKDGVCNICPKYVIWGASCVLDDGTFKACNDCRREFWMQEVE